MNTASIAQFNKNHRWLSNFWPCEINLDGDPYASVEHAYQAAKTLDLDQRAVIGSSGTTAAMAKQLGKHVCLRPGWSEIRLPVMRSLLAQKFALGTDLAQWLIATGDAQLVEGNTWNDTFWGVCAGRGENHLGVLLMQQRQFLKEQHL